MKAAWYTEAAQEHSTGRTLVRISVIGRDFRYKKIINVTNGYPCSKEVAEIIEEFTEYMKTKGKAK